MSDNRSDSRESGLNSLAPSGASSFGAVSLNREELYMRATIVLFILSLLPTQAAFGQVVHSPLWDIDTIVVRTLVDKSDAVPMKIDPRKLGETATNILQDALTRHAVAGVHIVDSRDANLFARETLTLWVHVFIRPEFGDEDKHEAPILIVVMEFRRYGNPAAELSHVPPPDVLTLSGDSPDVGGRISEILSREFDAVANQINHPVSDVGPDHEIVLPHSAQ